MWIAVASMAVVTVALTFLLPRIHSQELPVRS